MIKDSKDYPAPPASLAQLATQAPKAQPAPKVNKVIPGPKAMSAPLDTSDHVVCPGLPVWMEPKATKGPPAPMAPEETREPPARSALLAPPA